MIDCCIAERRRENIMNNENENEPLQGQQQQRKKYKCCCHTTVIAVIAIIVLSLIVLVNVIALGVKFDAVSGIEQEIYERIGNNKCPAVPGTDLVYEGFTAGFITPSGATTYNCLPRDEDEIEITYYNNSYSVYKDPAEIRRVNVTEYRTFRENKNYHDASCAVCSVTGRNTIKLFPARDQCIDSSWTREYYGYLMTDNSSTTFTCVDIDMVTLPYSEVPGPRAPTLNHVVVDELTHTAGYEKQKVLSCAVCSK